VEKGWQNEKKIPEVRKNIKIESKETLSPLPPLRVSVYEWTDYAPLSGVRQDNHACSRGIKKN